MRNVLIWLIGLLFVSSFVSADLIDYYPLDSDFGDDNRTLHGIYDYVDFITQYRFEANGNDQFNNNQPATTVNVSFNSGILNNGAFFNGENSYIGYGDNNFLDENFTVMMWFRTDNTSKNQYLVNWVNSSGGNDNRVVLQINGGSLSGVNFNVSGSIVRSITGNTALQNDTWYHVTYTVNGNDSDLYINGSLDTPYTVVASNPGSDTDITSRRMEIGRRANTGSLHFNGSLDDFRLFNRSIEVEEILAWYDGGNGTQLLQPFVSGQVDDGIGLYKHNNIQTPPDVYVDDDWSVGMWVYFHSVASFQQFLFQMKAVSGNNNNFQLLVNNGQIQATALSENYGVDSRSWQQYSLASTHVSAGQWYHLGMTWNGSNLTVFRNGVPIVTNSITAHDMNMSASSRNITLGNREAKDSPLHGILDDFRLYNNSIPDSWFLMFNSSNNASVNITDVTQSGYYVGSGLGPVCQYDISEPSSIGYWVWNVNDTNMTHGFGNYTILENDLFDDLEFGCELCYDDICFNSTNNISLSNQVNKKVQFHIRGNNSVVISSIEVDFNDSYFDDECYTTPCEFDLTEFISGPADNYNGTLNVTDSNGVYAKTAFTFLVNASETNFTINMSYNTLWLNFTNSSGDANVSSGKIINGGWGDTLFYNTSIMFGSPNWLPNSLVTVLINGNSTNDQDYLQRYEFINDGAPYHDSVMLITDDTSVHGIYYYRILDQDDKPISEVKVRVKAAQFYQSNWANLSLTNQLISDDNGYVHFYADNTKYVILEVSKDKYTQQSYLIANLPDKENNAKADADIIRMTESVGVFVNSTYVLANKYYNNETDFLYGVVYLGDIPTNMDATIYIETDFSVTANNTREKVNLDDFDRAEYSLKKGKFFNYPTPTNFTITYYKQYCLEGSAICEDLALIGTWDVEYRAVASNKWFDLITISEDVSELMFSILFLLGVLTIAAFMSTKFDSPNVGFHIFMLSGFVGFVVNSGFQYWAYSAGLYYLIRYFYSITGE